MAITKLNPRKIHLAGPVVVVHEHMSSEAITPGMLVELHDSTGIKVRANASATELQALSVALDIPENNKGIDDDYASGDMVKIGYLTVGSVFYGIIPSGQDISLCELLVSNADGKLKTAGTTTEAASLGKFQSLDAPGAVVADTRIRVQVIT